MRTINLHRLLFLISFFLSIPFASSFALELQGLMYDEKNPEESIVVIDGESIQKGDMHQGYVVEEVGPNWVQIYNDETGDIKRLKIQDTEDEMKRKQTKAVAEAETEETVVKEKESFIQQIVNGPKRVINYVIELKAIYDLVITNNACVHYYQKMGFFPRHFKQLTRAGLINESYEDGESFKYKFYFDRTTNPDMLGLHADPIDPDSGLRYFFVGVDAVIRVAEGKPATIMSPVHDYPGSKK